MVHQALGELGDSFLRLSLLYQCPATQDNATRPPLRKPLFRGKADGGFGTLLGGTPFAAELMEWSCITQGDTEAKGVCSLLRQRHRVLALRQPLVRIPQIPQRPSSKDVAHDTSILSAEECRGMVLMGVVEFYPLRKVCVR